MICARCDKPIPDGQAVPVDMPRPTGAGVTLHVHKRLCKKVLTQTAPASSRRLIRET